MLSKATRGQFSDTTSKNYVTLKRDAEDRKLS